MYPCVAPTASAAIVMPSISDERIALHQHAIGERARVAFVGVAGHILLWRGGIEDRFPFDAGGKGSATPAAQT